MHLPDHYLDPLTCAATAIVSGGAIAYSLVRVRHEPKRKVLAAAAAGAAIFSAQMINFPIASATSGHFVGGALAGVLLGPWTGLLTIAAVLSVQALLFGDGGVLALGANILNMGVIGVVIGVVLQRAATSAKSKTTKAPGSAGGCTFNHPSLCATTWSGILTVVLAGWLSVVLAAFACALEMAMSGAVAASEVVPTMLRVHLLIGLAEGAITAAAVVGISFVVQQSMRLPRIAPDRLLAAGLTLAAILLIGLAPLASSQPDGLSRVAETLQAPAFDEMPEVPALFPDYAWPGIAWPPLATWLAAGLGAGLVYGLTGTTVYCCRLPFGRPGSLE